MEKLFNALNIGYITNSSEVKVVFNKKFILILEKLLKINCIESFTFDENFIFIKLRYYKNKPLFFFLIKSKRGNKIYKDFCKNVDYSKQISNISLFFTDKGLLTTQESFLKKLVVNILWILFL